MALQTYVAASVVTYLCVVFQTLALNSENDAEFCEIDNDERTLRDGFQTLPKPSPPSLTRCGISKSGGVRSNR